MAKIRTLSKSSVINLQRMSDRLNLLEQATSGGRSRYRDSSAHFLVKTPTAGIPALASTTPGSAICKIVKRMSSGLVDTGRDQKVYNLGNAVDGGQIVVAHRDAFGDLWVTDEASCDTLKPGTYRAIAGATIEPGETGPIVITGCDGEVSVDAVNHSECTFYFGDRITASVDPCCVVHFTGCSCCGSSHEPPACCDISIAICIAGVSKILKVDGGTYTWTVADCCDCTGATFAVTLSCSGSNIAADWTYTCGESVTNGTIDLDALCNFDSDVEIVDQLSICSGSLSDRWANFVEECDPCSEDDPCADPNDCVETECCPDNLIPKTLTLTLVGGTHAGAYGMTWDGVSEWVIDGTPGFTARLSCLGGGNFWELSLEMETYGENTATCDPFGLTFDTSAPVWDIGSVSASIS